jgi:hypothetical protein
MEEGYRCVKNIWRETCLNIYLKICLKTWMKTYGADISLIRNSLDLSLDGSFGAVYHRHQNNIDIKMYHC